MQTFKLVAFCLAFPILGDTSAHALTSGSTTCNIQYVQLPAKGPRLLVKCEASAPGAGGAKIEYFAFHMGQDMERARLILSMLMTAKAAGRPVRITYYTDETTTNAWDMGCNPQDCRPIVWLEMQ